MKRQPGRPKQLKLVTIDEALELVKQHYHGHPAAVPAKGTIYNKISLGILKNHGPRSCALLDEAEVREKLCS